MVCVGVFDPVLHKCPLGIGSVHFADWLAHPLLLSGIILYMSTCTAQPGVLPCCYAVMKDMHAQHGQESKHAGTPWLIVDCCPCLPAPANLLQSCMSPAALASRIRYIVDTSEMIWGSLDAGDVLAASLRFLRAATVHKLLLSAAGPAVTARFPLVAHQWPAIEKFKWGSCSDENVSWGCPIHMCTLS